jgi:hypothetical protein
VGLDWTRSRLSQPPALTMSLSVMAAAYAQHRRREPQARVPGAGEPCQFAFPMCSAGLDPRLRVQSDAPLLRVTQRRGGAVS